MRFWPPTRSSQGPLHRAYTVTGQEVSFIENHISAPNAYAPLAMPPR
jgi:hypothetical protein